VKKAYIYTLIVIAVLVAAGGVWYFVAHKTTNNNMNSMNMSNSSASTTNQSQVTTNAVTIQNFAFSPANITVKKNTTVTWTNKDSVAHTVMETDGQTGPNSNDINQGAKYSFTFNTPGTYHYHCSIHPEMVGTVTVTD